MEYFEQIKSKRRRNIIIIIVLILTIIAYLTFVRGTYATSDVIIVKHLEVGDGQLDIRGNTMNSSMGFSGYKYTIVDKKLYLQLRYSLVSKINPTGEYKISINDEEMNSVNRIFIQGKEKDDYKLAWMRGRQGGKNE